MAIDRMIVPKDRVFERGRGCYNCKHFENGALARNHWRSRRPQDEIAILERTGGIANLGTISSNDQRFQSLNDMEKAVMMGQAGMCMVGKVQTDFVHFKYLCDAWTGKEGASAATEGHPLDPLPAELKEIVEARAKKRED